MTMKANLNLSNLVYLKPSLMFCLCTFLSLLILKCLSLSNLCGHLHSKNLAIYQELVTIKILFILSNSQKPSKCLFQSLLLLFVVLLRFYNTGTGYKDGHWTMDFSRSRFLHKRTCNPPDLYSTAQVSSKIRV